MTSEISQPKKDKYFFEVPRIVTCIVSHVDWWLPGATERKNREFQDNRHKVSAMQDG